MATSAAQITANRANAQLSTGPKTDAGKLASSSNALRSGLTSSKLFIRPEDLETFDKFQTTLLDSLNPSGPLEQHLFDLILHSAWNIQRCISLEAEIQNEANSQGLPDALLDNTLAPKLDRIYRYKKMHESSQRHAIAELRRLQTEQLWRAKSAESQTGVSALASAPAVHQSIARTITIHGKNKAKMTREIFDALLSPPPVPNTAWPPEEEKATAVR